MQPLARGAYVARLVKGDDDLTEAQALRHLAFRHRAGLDHDGFDAQCRHLLVHEVAGTVRGAGGASGDSSVRGTGVLVACCRLQDFPPGTDLATSYAAQFYDLRRLSDHPGAKIELGRFCLHPARHDPDILRLVWGALTAIVDEGEVALLFGCTSFAGAGPGQHLAALAALRRHVAPPDLRPGPRAAERVALPDIAPRADEVPPLLRSYLAMGGYVSDHAVVDRDLDTLHVLTALLTDKVPAARARALRAIAHPELAEGPAGPVG